MRVVALKGMSGFSLFLLDLVQKSSMDGTFFFFFVASCRGEANLIYKLFHWCWNLYTTTGTLSYVARSLSLQGLITATIGDYRRECSWEKKGFRGRFSSAVPIA